MFPLERPASVVQVRLLGTGSADGWPNPFCQCASCAWSRDAGCIRSNTCVVVDDVIMIDCGPDALRSAARLGVDLSDVEHVVLSHSHPDHSAPLAALVRSWVPGVQPWQVHGPADAVAMWEPWFAPDFGGLNVFATEETSQVATRRGDYFVTPIAASHTVPGGTAVLPLIETPDGSLLLYASDTGPLTPAALDQLTDRCNGRVLDVVLLEETFGDRDGSPHGHHDLTTFPATIAEFRRRGLVTDTTRVIAIHLSHFNPPVPELNRRLAEWGAEVLCDGALLVTDRVGPELAPDPERRAGRRVLITGGARSGKSVEAERRVAAAASMTYVATAAPRLTESGAGDPEWERRIDLHRTRRPAHWETVEVGDWPGQLAELVASDRPAVLVDCLTLWLTSVIDATDLWTLSPRDEGYESAMTVVFSEIDRLAFAVSSARGLRVLVTNEVGSGVVPATPSGRLFQDLLGSLNARIASVCDEVNLVVAGQVLPLRTSAIAHVSVAHSCG